MQVSFVYFFFILKIFMKYISLHELLSAEEGYAGAIRED